MGRRTAKQLANKHNAQGSPHLGRPPKAVNSSPPIICNVFAPPFLISEPRPHCAPHIFSPTSSPPPEAVQQRKKRRSAPQHTIHFVEMSLTDSPSFTSPSPQLVHLDHQHQAVLQFATERIRNGGHISNKRASVIGIPLGITSSQHLRRLAARALTGEPLIRKAGSGRRCSVSIQKILNWVSEQMIENKGDVSETRLAVEMKAKFGVGSATSVRRMLKTLGYRAVSRRVLPILTDQHRKCRLQWVKAIQAHSPPWSLTAESVHVFVDEKWFFGQQLHKRVFKGPGVPHPATHVGSKSHIPKVMFLGAIARPCREHGFNGRIGLYPITELKQVTRLQMHFNKGDMKHHLLNLDAELFKKMMKEKVCSDLVQQTGEWASTFIIQMDSAGGHGGGNGDLNQTTIAELNKWANLWPPELKSLLPLDRQAAPPHWVFMAQPARSPDLNMLDLGAWCSINPLVPEIKIALDAAAPIEQVISNVQQAWSQWNSSEKLAQLDDTLQHIFPLIEKCEGGNLYEMPHFH